MFRQSFKYYKSKCPPPSFEEVIDFHNEEFTKNYPKIKRITNIKQQESSPLLKASSEWQVFQLLANPGFLYIKNPFTTLGQRYWIMRSLRDFTGKPNLLNIDFLNLVPADNDWWSYAQTNNDVLQKLRWATMGYHHNWDTKVYSEDLRGPFPSDLSQLCSLIANAMGIDDYNSEAAIVNFYHLDSTLSGHTDHSEPNVDAPIFSLSFGNSAVFLLGTDSLEDKPSALFLHSGDIVVMGRESRLSYHAVPKIIKTPQERQTWNLPVSYSSEFAELEMYKEFCDDSNFEPFRQYLSGSRININVRQVLKKGQKTLNN